MKKTLALFLSLILCLSGVGAFADVVLDSTWPIVDEPLSVTIAVKPQNAGEYDLDSMWQSMYWDEFSGLDITWMHIDAASAKEKIPLMIAGDTMPDAIMGYNFSVSDIVRYGVDEQMFYPVDELLDYMPNFKELLETEESIRVSVTASDGHIYGVPSVASFAVPFILRWFVNATWLENVGMEMPTTLDELYDVLVAFRDQDANGNGDPTDEIPLSDAWNEGYSLRAWILNSVGFNTTGTNTALYYDADGVASPAYIPYTEQYKDYLAYMNKLWSEGLLDQDMFTQTQSQVDAKITDDLVGYVGCSAPEAVDPTKKLFWLGAQPLASALNANPNQPMSAAINGFYFVINSNCDEEVAAALANFADSFFTMEMFNLIQIGPEFIEGDTAPAMTTSGPQYTTEFGAFWNEEAQVRDWYYDSANYSSAWAWRTTEVSTWSYPGYNGSGHDAFIEEYAALYPDSVQGKYVAAGCPGEYWKETSAVAQVPYLKPVLPNLFYTVDDAEITSEISTMMDEYVAGMEAKFITGELSLETDYEAFIETLEQYGVQEYMEIVCRYYYGE